MIAQFPVFQMSVGQSDKHMGEFGRNTLAFECQLILLDSFRFILQVEKAMGFHEVGFSKILIGSQGKIAGFNGFLKFLPVKMRFGQSGPIGRIVRIFIYQFVIDIDCLLVVIATAVTVRHSGQKILFFFVFLYAERKPR